MPEEKLYTTQEVAELVGVSNRTIRLWAAAGKVVAWKTPGGHRRYTEVEVRRLREQLAAAPATGRPGILVVEADPDLLMLYRLGIQSWNIPVDVLTAPDVYEGLLTTGLYKPAVIIFDVDTAQSDGFRMLDVVTASDRLRDSLVIVVSDMSREEIRSRTTRADSISVYSKPIPFGVIRERVIAHLGTTIRRQS